MGVHEEAEGWAGNDTNEMTDPNGAAVARARRDQHRRGGLPRRAARRRDDGRRQARLGQPDRRPDRRDQDVGRAHGRRAGDPARRVGEVRARREPEARVRRPEEDAVDAPRRRAVIRDAFVDAQNYADEARRGRRRRASRSTATSPRRRSPRVLDGRAAAGTSTRTAPTTSPPRSASPRSSATGWSSTTAPRRHMIADVLAEKRRPGDLRPAVHLALQGRAARPRHRQPRR